MKTSVSTLVVLVILFVFMALPFLLLVYRQRSARDESSDNQNDDPGKDPEHPETKKDASQGNTHPKRTKRAA